MRQDMIWRSRVLSSLGARHISSGVDNFRRVLQQLRNDVQVEALAASASRGSTTATGKGVASSLGGDSLSAKASLHSSATLIKELLRVFTRKVPGELVPDALVRGFMQAYRDLTAPQERLAFFRLLSQEMGLSVAEVGSAVRQWEAALAGSRPSVVTANDAESRSQAAAAAFAATAAAAAAEPPSDAVLRAADRMSSACRPLYAQLFLPISQAPEGMKFLMDMRADLLHLAEKQQQQADITAASVPLRAMAEALRHSLAEWFSVGLLHLQPISWQESSAALLERVMRCEAVHPLDGWEELRRRLGPRRRVFAFTHPSMPGEPLVVLHAALMDRPAAAMSDILDEQQQQKHQHQPQQQRQHVHHDRHSPPSPDPHPSTPPPGFSQTHPSALPLPAPPSPLAADMQPTTAVLYSISASQPGLRGIDLGQFLIKRAAERLMVEFPSIHRLVTLSPLPNYRSWLISRLRQEQSQAAPASPGQSDRADGAGAGCSVGGAPLLRSQEAAEMLRLAEAVGWVGAPEAAGGMATTAVAAAALCWLLEEDRWLQLPGRRTARGEGLLASAGGSSDGGGGSSSGFGRPASAAAEDVLRPLLMRLAATYLVAEKRRRFALCPVAHFHLRNGASLWRLNWRADMSGLGLSRSFGIMVNYEYNLTHVYDNNWKYIMLHEVQAHPQVRELL